MGNQAMTRVTRHFTVAELACPCCGACEMDKEFMRKAQVLRDIVDFPLQFHIDGREGPAVSWGY